jgi:hypothetical protein
MHKALMTKAWPRGMLPAANQADASRIQLRAVYARSRTDVCIKPIEADHV